MATYSHYGAFILVALVILIAGCLEPPIQEPEVSVADISLSDVSLQKMTVNTTIVIFNPNPVGAKLNKVAFEIYYLDEGMKYLGHGEKTDIEVRDNGNTTVIIPVTIDNIQALQAAGNLVRKGNLTLNVNGSAFIDVKVTSYEKRFEQDRHFNASDFEGLLPVLSISGTSVNITEKLGQLGGFLDAVSG